METLRQINEWGFQLMFLVLSLAGMAWCGVGIVEAVGYAVREWFKPAKRPATKSAGEAVNGTKQ